MTTETEQTDRHAATIEAIGKANGEVKPDAVDKSPAPADDDSTPDTATAAPVETTDEDTDDSAASDGTDSPAPPRKKPGVHQRIDELTWEKHEERRGRERAEQEAAYWRQQAQLAAQGPQATASQMPSGEPTLEQFGYDEAQFRPAHTQWLIEQAKQSVRQEIQQEQAQRQIQVQGSEFRKGIDALEKESPGAWQEAINAPIVTTPAMEQAIFQSGELGPRIGFYLAKHPDEAQAIAQMHPLNQAVAIGEIRAQLKAPPSRVQPKTVTTAPAPPPVSQSASKISKSLADETIDDAIRRIREKEAHR